MERNQQKYAELASLFFAMKQAIRAELPQKDHADPNAWMRCELLRFIETAQQPSMQDIAKHLRVTAPSATSLVRKLGRMGWVERKTSVSDKRTVRVSLTSKGKRELRKYRRRSEGIMRSVFSKLPDSDLRHLRRILSSLQIGSRT